jgi:Kdo2-lipid IVA lauroyltransferase/acyltransferase
MGEAAAKAAGPPGRRRLDRAGGPGTVPAGRLPRRAEDAAYWLAVAPLAAPLPASLAYRVACWRGDWNYRYRAGKRSEIVRNLRLVLGDELGPGEAERLARDFFRFRSCHVIDVMRLRGRARSLGRLVEIRGREHLDAALAGGMGAILCSAHFGSHDSAFSLLHASGFPVTSIGRWRWNYTPGLSSAERRFCDLVWARRVLRHRQRPNIEPWPGRVQVAVQAAAVLRANEVVTICSDAAPLDAERASAVEVAFLGRQARLLPGVVTLARLTGAPVLMAFAHRLADYRHQVLEISPPVPVEGETVTAFERCVAAMDAAIRTSPAHWMFWHSTDDLASLGLLPAAPPAGTAAVTPQSAIGEPAALLEDRCSALDHHGSQRGQCEGHGSSAAVHDDQADCEEQRSLLMAAAPGGTSAGREPSPPETSRDRHQPGPTAAV